MTLKIHPIGWLAGLPYRSDHGTNAVNCLREQSSMLNRVQLPAFLLFRYNARVRERDEPPRTEAEHAEEKIS